MRQSGESVLPFVEATEDDRGKGDGPDAIIDFFEGDGLIGERDGHKQRRAPGDVAILIDAPDLRMPGIVERREPARQGPRRAVIVLRRDRLVQAFVRPVLVVLGAEAGEAALLCAAALEAGGRAVSALSTL